MRQADLTDVASDVSENMREAALTHQQQRAQGMKRPYAKDCVVCDSFIPIERQKGTGGTNICVACMSEMERRR